MPADEAIDGILAAAKEGDVLAELSDRLVDLAGGIGGGPPWPPNNYGAVMSLLEAAKLMSNAKAALDRASLLVAEGACRADFVPSDRGRSITPAGWRYRLQQAGYSSLEIDRMAKGEPPQ